MNGDRRSKGSDKIWTQRAKRWVYFHLLILVLIMGFIAAWVCFLLQRSHARTQVQAPPWIKEESTSPGIKAGLDRLKGRWVLPDGDYVIEIKEVDPSGKILAAYYNPKPIYISRAEASQEGAETKIFIELQDPNYPGAIYTLSYDPEKDQLRGVYFQPTLRQSLDVVFVRLK